MLDQPETSGGRTLRDAARIIFITSATSRLLAGSHEYDGVEGEDESLGWPDRRML